MRKCVILILNFVLVLIVYSSGVRAEQQPAKMATQAGTEQKQDPASQEGLDKLTKEISRLNRAIIAAQTANQKEAEKLKLEREKAEKARAELQKRTDEALNKTRAEIAMASEARRLAEEKSSKRTNWLLGGIAIVGLLVTFGSLYVSVVVRRSRKTPEVVVHHTHEPAKGNQGPLQDPDADVLREWAKENGYTERAPFFMKLEKERKNPLCVALLTEKELLIVNVDGVELEDRIAWNTKKGKVAKHLDGDRKLQLVVNQ